MTVAEYIQTVKLLEREFSTEPHQFKEAMANIRCFDAEDGESVKAYNEALERCIHMEDLRYGSL